MCRGDIPELLYHSLIMKHDNDPVLTAIGSHIRKLRESAGHSQEAFASIAKVDRAYYGSVERGEVNISILTLARIAKAMQLEMKDLIPNTVL